MMSVLFRIAVTNSPVRRENIATFIHSKRHVHEHLMGSRYNIIMIIKNVFILDIVLESFNIQCMYNEVNW